MVTFVTTDPSGRWTGTGVPILPAQVDENFYLINKAVEDITLQAPVSIASISATGTTILIEFTDLSQTTVEMPTPVYNQRNAWAAGVSYAPMDAFFSGLSAYFVNYAHTSLAPFNPDATDGAGRKLYTKIITVPEPSLPTGGVAGAVLTKNSATNGDASWVKEPGVSSLVNAAGAVTLDYSTGKVKRINLTGDITSMSISNFGVAGSAQEMTLEVTNVTPNTIVWPSGVKWPGGTEPTLVAGASLFRFLAFDASGTIYAREIGAAFA